MTARSAEGARPLRADARQNREQIIAAARDVFVEQGPGAPLEDISRRAGTGIATLYRRFPDRHSLMRAVVLDALERSARAAEQARAAEPEPLDALTRYMHNLLDIRTAAVIPAILSEFSMDDEDVEHASQASARATQELVEAAHDAGTLHPDVTFADIGLMVIRLSRPFPGTFSPEVNASLAHRHLDLLIGGLRATAEHPVSLSGPALGLGDLRTMSAQGGD